MFYIYAILLNYYGVNGFAEEVHPTYGIPKSSFMHKRKIQQFRYIHNEEQYNNFSLDIYLCILFFRENLTR
jgi:hypothetical protein